MSSQITQSDLPFDQEMVDIVDYVMNYRVTSELAYKQHGTASLTPLVVALNLWSIRLVPNCSVRLLPDNESRMVFEYLERILN